LTSSTSPRDLGVRNVITPVEGRQNIAHSAREHLIDVTHREQCQDGFRKWVRQFDIVPPNGFEILKRKSSATPLAKADVFA
jgi:hypothetical protein